MINVTDDLDVVLAKQNILQLLYSIQQFLIAKVSKTVVHILNLSNAIVHTKVTNYNNILKVFYCNIAAKAFSVVEAHAKVVLSCSIAQKIFSLQQRIQKLSISIVYTKDVNWNRASIVVNCYGAYKSS